MNLPYIVDLSNGDAAVRRLIKASNLCRFPALFDGHVT